MTAPLVDLIAQACGAGVVIGRSTDGALTLRAPAAAAAHASTLRAREADVLTLFDWHGATLGVPRPCILCQVPAILRDPIDRRPCHKVCVDRLLTEAAQPAPRQRRQGKRASR